MKRCTLIILTFLLVEIPAGLAQVSVQISNYPVHELNAGNQNWDIASDGEQIFVANNHGLLILRNEDIQRHEISDQSIIRSVAHIGGKIFTGSFEEFGYWEEDESGELQYRSLVPLLDNTDMSNDEIWKIIEHEDRIYFHSFGSIYCYDGEKVYRVDTPGSMMFPYRINDKIYAQKVRGRLYRLRNDRFEPVSGSDFLEDEEVKSIIELSDSTLLIGTSDGLYSYGRDSFSVWTAENKEEVIRSKINAIARTKDKIVIGTILNGLYIYDLDFNLLKNINTENQLQNNTILSITADRFDNIWVGMDKGLDYIAFDTPVQTYREESQGIGSVYTAALYHNDLYVGTNQGIYKFNRDRHGNFNNRKLIPGSQGQVWFIKEFDGKLYSGLNDGTYVLENDRLRKVGNVDGGYTLKSYPDEKQEILLQSTYNDLVVYRKEGSTWEQSYTLAGFSTPARFLEFDHLGNIWLGHSVKGIFQLQPNISFDTVDQVRKFTPSDGLPKSSNRIFKLDNRIMVPSGDSLYQWDTIDERFVPFTELDPYFTEKGAISNIVPVGNQRYWVIKHNEISLFEIHFNSVRLLYLLLPQMYDFDMVEGYENVIPLNDNMHLVCLDEGFAILNMDLIRHSKYPKPSVSLQSIEVTNYQNETSIIEPDTSSPIELAYRDNTVNLNWKTSQTVGDLTHFQYKLEGLESDWNSWTAETQASYLRLPSGSYTFKIRAIGPNGLLAETMSVPLTIEGPWYFSIWAYLFYALILGSFIFMIRLYISRKRWRKLTEELRRDRKKMLLEKEKAEKEIVELTNRQLQTEVEHKASQLALKTMAILRKNKLLNSIKTTLDKQKQKLGDRYPNKYYEELTKLIEKGIEDEREWEQFEQLYDQAHGGFFKRLKEKYPDLTPADLRLCVYLRMNLSSKEIAPLLNISVRGVEERRYRLRKRLDISTDTNLTELIMTF